ncbi:hypothetical protein E5720_18710 [Rhodococcus sp. PAMC28707]|uniref:hypothetical protein n=1 Tax=unclassified Rhodococcus (in: high G+C Gram-positive bacteria) TaxID=192944 RepID=UPI00109D867A|nr:MULTISPECIES: hypothetical protein [unclassified Rhodococcus (in: high G+C Gram-positive bacteria)]QCB51629.1 hypothetical protein E5769_16815 [Rhodococcus sp. PAMC28705]QCB60204.1 hypothetical protein E5720_18710 [Rhodococcus sp. PAMC28707]
MTDSLRPTTTIGADTAKASEIHRIAPRLVRNQKNAATPTTRAPTVTASNASVRAPANATSTATAPIAAPKAARAAQRWLTEGRLFVVKTHNHTSVIGMLLHRPCPRC